MPVLFKFCNLSRKRYTRKYSCVSVAVDRDVVRLLFQRCVLGGGPHLPLNHRRLSCVSVTSSPCWAAVVVRVRVWNRDCVNRYWDGTVLMTE